MNWSWQLSKCTRQRVLLLEYSTTLGCYCNLPDVSVQSMCDSGSCRLVASMNDSYTVGTKVLMAPKHFHAPPIPGACVVDPSY